MTKQINYGERYLIHARAAEAKRRVDDAVAALEKAEDEWHQACRAEEGMSERDAVEMLLDWFPAGHPAIDELIGVRAACARLKKWNDEAKAEIERLQAEIQDWHECALYDALMSGPVFKGWNRSALERCRVKYVDKERKE